ncbi:MAG TPA: hypothetical protein VHX66_16970 [Solirubrobacteraceae bacterium]|jgi:hypothetical protein|nr:hypothetical protein [Solirubrobacteraceae bacterium]
MTKDLAGRGISMVGIICGLLAVGLVLFSTGSATARYLDHGVVVAFVIALLAGASYLPAEVGFDTLGAALGTVAFGFYLYVPAIFAFSHLGTPGPAAWLGLGTILIPLGLSVVRSAGHGDPAPPMQPTPSSPHFALAFAGVVLMAVGIWLPVISDHASFWNLSFSGHALGILLLIAVVANAVALLGVGVFARAALLIACATFGLTAAAWLTEAFSHLDSLGSGGWIEAVGGLLLIGGVVAMRLGAAPAPAAAPAPS